MMCMGVPFSSTVYTDVLPTDTCLSFCPVGEGMWYQQSPANRSNLSNAAAEIPQAML